MKTEQFLDLREVLDKEATRILADRGPAYAGQGGDRLANFKLIAQLLDNFHVNTATPEGTWAVYFLKHVLSILAHIGQGPEGEEKILGRIVDARNYLDLFYAMTWEEASPPIMPQSNYVPGKPCPDCGYICMFPERHPTCCACNAKGY